MAKYFTIFSLSFLNGLKNYKALIGLSIFLVTCLIIFAHVWKIAVAKTGAIIDLTPQQLLWYIALNEWILVSYPETHQEMELDLRSGRLAYILPRPMSYLAATFAEAAGLLCVNLLFLGAITFIFAWYQTGIFPFSLSGFVITLLFGFAAGFLLILIQMIVGLCAFWLQDVAPISWISEKLLFAFGGLMLPLAVYPEWLQKIVYLTPFPTILGDRSILIIDFNFQSFNTLLFSFIAWIALGLATLAVMYRCGLRILNIEGG